MYQTLMSVMVFMVVSTPVIMGLDLFPVPVIMDMSYSLMAQLVKVNFSRSYSTVVIGLPHANIIL